jgi:hypothetical protein
MPKILISAGLGGILPTLCHLAASYSTDPSQPMPEIGVYFALVLFFFIGTAVAFGLEETVLKKAFVLGIAGPAVVASFVNGASHSKGSTTAAIDHITIRQFSKILGISDANADAAATTASSPIGGPSPTSSAPQLIVDPAFSGVSTLSSNMLMRVQFLASDGGMLSQSSISPLQPSTLIVPPGANSVVVTIAEEARTTQLPSTSFLSAHLNVSISMQPSGDFTWALGGQRSFAIKSLSISLSDVRPIPAPQPSNDVPPSFDTKVIAILKAHLPASQLYIREVAKGIPPRKLRHAIEERETDKPDAASVIGLLDGTVLGSASVHILFTSVGIYVRTSALRTSGPRESYVAYKDFPRIEFKKLGRFEVGIGESQTFDLSGAGISAPKLVDIFDSLKMAIAAPATPQ